MLSTDSLPRKWSIRNTSDSENAACTTLFSARADSRSVPNGFSMITRARWSSFVAASISSTDGNADGGIARW